MKALVDPDLCISCGLCPSIAPEVFQMNEEGIAENYSGEENDGMTQVQQAVDSCPVAAIRWAE
ncbi:MAG: ferredoxin [Lachnospiraceae bacterium]|nr:ferredoxin [Lachnospiraceae bacterium]